VTAPELPDPTVGSTSGTASVGDGAIDAAVSLDVV